MKPYAILLAVLWLASVAVDFWTLTASLPLAFALKSLADIVLFTLCLLVAVELAFSRVLVTLSTPQLRLVYNATLFVGGAHVMLNNFGDLLGVPSPVGDTSILQIGLDFLPYLLFSIPAIVLEHERKKAGQD